MIKNQAEEIRAYLLDKIPLHPKNIVAKASKAFACSRTTVHRHLNRLLRDRQIIKSGNTRQIQYFLKKDKNKEVIISLKNKFEEHKVWQENFQKDFEMLPKNIRDICEYGFLTILNNAIQHSGGTEVKIFSEWTQESLELVIRDNGIGIFRKIKNVFDLKDERESILHLSKGKFTTNKENHTGEGIFFASRSFDNFQILSQGLSFTRDSYNEDWFLGSSMALVIAGTVVKMIIGLNSKNKLQDIFSEFVEENLDGVLKFEKTDIIVKLSKLGDENYISRSQARRIILGLENFKYVVLDFKDVSVLGQGFVDEVFCVFKTKYPKTKIEYKNANNNVKFMIERCLN